MIIVQEQQSACRPTT